MGNLLGVDVGTTSLKMVLYGEDGQVLSSLQKEYTLETRGDMVEFPAEAYWNMFHDAYEQIRSQFPVDALSIDTQCETLIVTDDAGTPLQNAIVWLDNRAVAEAEQIQQHFGTRRVYEVTGQAEITATWPACKLLWLRNNEPDLFSRIRKVFLLEDYLLYRLTGRFVTERTLQSSSLYLDITIGNWWQEMLDFIGISAACLPQLMDSGCQVAVDRGTVIATSAMDQVAGAIGAGVVRPGIVSEMTGTTMVVFVPSEHMPAYQEGSRTPCHLNYDGKYALLLWTPTAGIALKWFRDNFCEAYSFPDLNVLAEKVAPGCDGLTFLPYLCGSTMPVYAPHAKGAFLGMTMEHTRGHAVRSIFESVACMLRQNLEYLDVRCHEIRSMGGGANSPLWCQIKADLTGKELQCLQSSETACLGSAILAGVAAGIYPDVPSACEKLVKTKASYAPSGTDYGFVYDRFCRLSTALFTQHLQ